MPESWNSRPRGIRLPITLQSTCVNLPNPSPQQPLLRLQAHWQLRAHRRYLEAANFHWPR